MKVLVTYFSQSGNTQKVAKSIWEEASLNHEADLKKMEEINAQDCVGYDLVFIGSPLHSANLATPVKEFLSAIPAGPNKKIAGFITHFAPAYPNQEMDEFIKPFKKACEEKQIQFKGCFHCQGALTESLHEPVKKKLGLSDEAWQGMVNQMTGHPDEKDVAEAREFAKRVMES